MKNTPTARWAGSHPTNTRANGHNTINNNQQPSKHPVHKTRPGQETDPAKLPHQVQQLTWQLAMFPAIKSGSVRDDSHTRVMGGIDASIRLRQL